MLCALTMRSTVAEDPPPGGNTEPPYGHPPCGIVPTEGTPVFEGAMGWAKYAFHNPPQNYNPNTWYEVTHPGDYLPGVETPIQHTLRYAIEQLTGPRNIKVLVNGEIKLKSMLSMDNQSYVKITGEYATGIGPTIIGDEFRIKDCDNVVLRYMRFRSGVLDPENLRYHCGRSLNIWGDQTGCNDIIVDHCSIGASRDDNISVSGKLCRVTVQNCIIGGGAIGYSRAGIGSAHGPAHEHERLTYCRNLITNTLERQLVFTGPGRVDFFNNVVSISRRALEIWSGDGTNGPKMNIIKNHFQTPNLYLSRSGFFEDPIRAVETENPYTPNSNSPLLVLSTGDNTLHISGNLYLRFNVTAGEYELTYTGNQWDMTVSQTSPPTAIYTNLATSLKKDGAWDMPSDTILDVEEVEGHVLANAGCRLPLSNPALDAYDQALRAAQLITGNSPSNVVFPDNLPTNDGIPGTPTLLYPLHQATGVPTTVTLTWDESDETDDYEVFLDTNAFPTTSIGVTLGHQIQVSNLQGNTLYRWRVVARDSCQQTASTLTRNFTTE
ncbi:MAG: hypothetical protein HBSAPP02_00950 [Phycisphaerae bacterium]|nr:MAG: hypothetical protein HBSAPP02_00950 [Phycisphaerae bacterium]